MKLKKFLACAAASTMAVSALAISASANIYIVDDAEKNPALTTIDGRWMIMIQNSDDIDCGIDITQIRSVEFYSEIVVAPDKVDSMTLDDFDFSGADGFGGSLIFSEGGGEVPDHIAALVDEGKIPESVATTIENTNFETEEEKREETIKKISDLLNWNGSEWWGFPKSGDSAEGDPTIGDGTNQGSISYEKALAMEYLNDFSYKISRTMTDDEVFLAGPDYCQVSLDEWGADKYFNLKVNLCVFRDADSNIILAYNEVGDIISVEDAQAKITEYETPKADAPSEDNTEDANDNDNDENEVADNDENADNTPATTTASSSSSGSSPSTGLVIGIVCGVVAVIIIVVVIVVVKKKK